MFWAKTVLVTPTALAMVLWISIKAGKDGEFFNEPSTIHGSTRAWLWLSSLTSITGGFSTLAVNIPDFSRFSKHRTSHYAQLPMIPFFKCIVGIFGVVAASASTKLYGKTLWSPLSIIAMWQGSSGGRAAAFFAAAVWMLAQICVNISANSVSFGNGKLRCHLVSINVLMCFRHYYVGSEVVQPETRRTLGSVLRWLGHVSCISLPAGLVW
jgi:NCS1 family nucleobase:cation symporter-1